jgi:hypothetical protein
MRRASRLQAMKTHEHRIADRQDRLYEADLEATVDALFRRCPTLCGFSVCDAEVLARNRGGLQRKTALFVTEVSVFPMRDLQAPAELGEEIVATLAELLEECPETCDLMRDRTFARTLQ